MIDILIQTFFITNIWILIYTTVLDFLNFNFPPVLHEFFFRNPVAYPEPFEIPLYLILTFITTILIYIAIQYFFPNWFNLTARWLDPKSRLIVKLIVLIILLFFFLSKLGQYPVAHSINPFINLHSKALYHAFFIFYISICSIITIELTILQRFLHQLKTRIIVYLFIGLIGLVIAFEPRFPVSPADYSFFLGPIYEILHGKTIYTDIPSQYGFLSILFFALMAKFSLFFLSLIQVIVWLLYGFEFFLFFYLVFRLTKSITIGTIGFFSLITIQYFSYVHPPQTGPLRFLPILLMFLLFHLHGKFDSKKFTFFVAVSSLWFIDSGISLILGYLLTIFLLTLVKYISVKQLFRCILLFLFWYGVIFGLLNIIHMSLGMDLINIANMFASIRKYAVSGLVMIPIEKDNYFWLFIAVYFISVLLFFREKKLKNNQLLLFSANTLFFSSTYFVGRSVPPNLFHIYLFALFPFILIINHLYSLHNSPIGKKILLATLFILILVIPTYERQEYITEVAIEKYHSFLQGNIFRPKLEDEIRDRYKDEIALINKNITDKEIVILSNDDTYLFYLIGKKNLLNTNPQVGIDMKSEMAPAIKEILRRCPKKIIGNCDIFHKCLSYDSYSGVFNIAPFILTEIENGCKNKYKPTICTKQICIAQSQ